VPPQSFPTFVGTWDVASANDGRVDRLAIAITDLM
jgi:hypothetical protein